MPAEDGVHTSQAAPLAWRGLAWRVAVVAVIVAGIAAFIVAVHGTGRADGTDGQNTGDSAAAQRVADGTGPVTIATAITRYVGVYGHQGDAKPWIRLMTPNRQGAPLTFLVIRQTKGWVKVLLPMRPNGSTGWVSTTAVGLSHTDYRIHVSLSHHRVELRKGARTVLTRPAATGLAKTPTPTGPFYVTVLIRTPDPHGLYGPYAFGLSAYSKVLYHFGGGPGQVGLHGTNEPSALGHAASNGCVRVSDDTVRTLAKIIPLGTPVTISA